VTCRELAEFIAEYLEGELPPTERQAFDRHLARCGNCARYLDGYRQTVALGKQALAVSDDPVPADVPEKLVEAIVRARRGDADGQD
jgi:anti-sigma factor RsiW